MKELETEQRLIRAYLLGELDEQGQEGLEQRLLTSPEFKETVLLIEDELVEDYLADGLSASERESFLSKYLVGQPQRRKLQALSALRDFAIDEAPVVPIPEVSSWQRFLAWLRNGNRLIQVAAVGVLILVVSTGAWLLLQDRAERNRRQAMISELYRLNRQEPDTAPPTEHVFSASLMPVMPRDPGATNTLTVPADASVVRLQLPLPSGQYRGYHATLRTVGGREVFSLGELRAKEAESGKQLSLKIPVGLLTPDYYQLEIGGLADTGAFEPIGTYSFRVLK
jgi:hypothetical protein